MQPSWNECYLLRRNNAKHFRTYITQIITLPIITDNRLSLTISNYDIQYAVFKFNNSTYIVISCKNKLCLLYLQRVGDIAKRWIHKAYECYMNSISSSVTKLVLLVFPAEKMVVCWARSDKRVAGIRNAQQATLVKASGKSTDFSQTSRSGS